MAQPAITIKDDDGQTYDLCYEDGPDFPVGLEGEMIERSYRDGYLEGALEAARWRKIDVDAIEAAWNARRQLRSDHGVTLASGRGAYRQGYGVDAARLRGRVQALSNAEEAWNDLVKEGVDPQMIAPFVLRQWAMLAEAWTHNEVVPEHLYIPPFPSHCLDADQRRVLIKAKPANPEPADEDVPIPRERSVAELIRDYRSLREPVIEGLLRQGEIMNIISTPKMGKSWLVTDLALSVATGTPWLGYPTRRGRALIIDNELHGQTTANRIPKVAAARGLHLGQFAQYLFVDNLRGHLIDLVAMERYFNQIEPGRYSVIVLDAFYRFMPADTDENDNGGMADLYNRLDRYAQRLGSSFILIHHTTKGNQSEKGVTDVGAGAGSQSRAADAHVILRPHAEDGVVVLDAAVRSWPPVEPRCLRWSFPVYNLADDLDPTELKRPMKRRPKEASKDVEPAKPEWTPDRFAREFITNEPVEMGTIILKATGAGLSRNKAKMLLGAAEDQGLAFRWMFGPNQKMKMATVPQPDEEG